MGSAKPELAAQQLDEAGALPLGERGGRLARADASDGGAIQQRNLWVDSRKVRKSGFFSSTAEVPFASFG
jgi:hypothetical protein